MLLQVGWGETTCVHFTNVFHNLGLVLFQNWCITSVTTKSTNNWSAKMAPCEPSDCNTGGGDIGGGDSICGGGGIGGGDSDSGSGDSGSGDSGKMICDNSDLPVSKVYYYFSLDKFSYLTAF